MSNAIIKNPVLADYIVPTTGQMVWLRRLVLMIVGSLALWASAKIQVPMFPVQMTMQTFVVLSIGAAFGSRLGAATVMLYLVEGAMGLPVFAGTPEKGIGLAYMFGGTGGYLIGFVLAAYIVGWLAECKFDRSVILMALAMLVGNIAIYVPGILWLAAPLVAIPALVGSEYAGYGFAKAIEWGLTPFVIGDLVKLALAAAIFPAIWTLIGKKRA